MGIRLNARGRKRIPGTPIVLNFGARSGVSWSLKLGRLTYSPKARRLSVNTPGIGSVQITPGRKAPARPPARGNIARTLAQPVDPEWEAWCIQHRRCPSCGSEIGDVCRTPKAKRPTKTHPERLASEPARPATPSGASGMLAATLRRVLGLLILAAVLVLVAPHVNLLP